jgi:hypothetical protein
MAVREIQDHASSHLAAQITAVPIIKISNNPT